jgi:hypothetical protein
MRRPVSEQPGIARAVRPTLDRLSATLAVAVLAHVGLLAACPRVLPPVARSADRFFTVDELIGNDLLPLPARRDQPSPQRQTTSPSGSPASSSLRNARPRAETRGASTRSHQASEWPPSRAAEGASAPATRHSASRIPGVGEPMRGARSSPPATRARLVTPGACRHFFPNDARDGSGVAVLSVRVGDTGAVSTPRLLEELPPRQGFGRAALGCASLLRFEPARSEAGERVASVSVVRLRFTRPES